MDESSNASASTTNVNTLYWFRKCLRLHDNPTLKECLKGSSTIRCVYFLDPWFACSQRSANSGMHKWKFLLESLEDLNKSLKKIQLRLFVVRGQPAKELPKLFKKWDINRMGFEYDSEPYGKKRDETIRRLAENAHVEVLSQVSHTLYDPAEIIRLNCGRVPYSYSRFQAIMSSIRLPDQPLPTLTLKDTQNCRPPIDSREEEIYRILTLTDLGFDSSVIKSTPWKGGESEALRRMRCHIQRKLHLCKSKSHKISGENMYYNESIISPYLRYGCISSRLVYHRMRDLMISQGVEKSNQSAVFGQLLWREFIYTICMNNVQFDKANGNPLCLQVAWTHDSEYLQRFERGRTGFPLIDAIMAQLEEEGWIHPLARLVVTRFLTWGGLWLSWEQGCKIFEDALLDSDWSLSAGFWMWTCSKPFISQFLHSFCPVLTGRKIDATGSYVRRYLPRLKNIPNEYIYSPWKAPLSVQKQSGCVVGVDYPVPMIDHEEVFRVNLKKLKLLIGKKDESAGTSKIMKPHPVVIKSTASTKAVITGPKATVFKAGGTASNSLTTVINQTVSASHSTINGANSLHRPNTTEHSVGVVVDRMSSTGLFHAITNKEVKEHRPTMSYPDAVEARCIPSTGFIVYPAKEEKVPCPSLVNLPKEACRIEEGLTSATPVLIYPPLTTAVKRAHRVISLPGMEEREDDTISKPELFVYHHGNNLLKKHHVPNFPETAGPEKRRKMTNRDLLDNEEESMLQYSPVDTSQVAMHDITNTVKETEHIPSNNFQHIIPTTNPHYTSANLCPLVNLMPSLTQSISKDHFHFLGPTIFHPLPYHHHINADVARLKQQLFDASSNVPPLVTVLPPFDHMSFCTPSPGACAVMAHANSILPKHKKSTIHHQGLPLPRNTTFHLLNRS